MNSLIDSNDYKQTNYDNGLEEVLENGKSLQLSQLYQRIKITDKPIPLDIVASQSDKVPSQVVLNENELRYKKLKEARDRLINQKYELKLTPVIPSPVKNYESKTHTEADVTDSAIFEPVSTKIFPSFKHREDRIRLLKRLIYKAERDSETPSTAPLNEKPTLVADNVEETGMAPVKLEPFGDIVLPPPSPLNPRIRHRKKLSNDKQNKTENDVFQGLDIVEEVNVKLEPEDHLLLDDAISKFQTLKMKELENDLLEPIESDENISHETNESKEGISESSNQLQEKFLIIDNRISQLELQMAQYELQMEKLNSQLQQNSTTPPQRGVSSRLLTSIAVTAIILSFFALSCVLAD